MRSESYGSIVWKQFRRHRLGYVALVVFSLLLLVGLYAPLLASSKPLVVRYGGEWYFPLFRYLFHRGFFTKGLDIFYNVLMFTFPAMVVSLALFPRSWKWRAFLGLVVVQFGFFGYFMVRTPSDPASDPALTLQRQKALARGEVDSWAFELRYMNSYARLNRVLRYRQRLQQHEAFVARYGSGLPTLWSRQEAHRSAELGRLEEKMSTLRSDYRAARDTLLVESDLAAEAIVRDYETAESKAAYLRDRRLWLERQNGRISFEVMPLLRPFHWQDDAGGEKSLNQQVKWWDLTRINRKDLVASLIFGIRVSLVVGVTAVLLSLLLGIPLGSISGYYGGRTDIVLCRFFEIWESMPTFFMLLMVIAILQTKSIFLVIAVLGIFGWTGFGRFLRGEVLKQRTLPYVEACRALGFPDSRIMFGHILPNAIPPLLTLLPFSMMAAITAEAGLSFLGLGEEGSASWGVLMDEGRSAFPAESYLLWPPAILLTILLVTIALVGDALRDALDPKMRA